MTALPLTASQESVHLQNTSLAYVPTRQPMHRQNRQSMLKISSRRGKLSPLCALVRAHRRTVVPWLNNSCSKKEEMVAAITNSRMVFKQAAGLPCSGPALGSCRKDYAHAMMLQGKNVATTLTTKHQHKHKESTDSLLTSWTPETSTAWIAWNHPTNTAEPLPGSDALCPSPTRPLHQQPTP